MEPNFTHDVFLSHSDQDSEVVRDIAQRLRADGVRVWFDEWEIQPGDNIPAKIEAGLEHSRMLVLCMSAAAFGSEWSRLESHTFRFKDPLNKERRFIPVKLDDAPRKGSLAQFSYIDWELAKREQEYPKLLEAIVNCGFTAISPKLSPSHLPVTDGSVVGEAIIPGVTLRFICRHNNTIGRIAWSPSGEFIAAPSSDGKISIWNTEDGKEYFKIRAHKKTVSSVDWSPDGTKLVAASDDSTASIFNFRYTRANRLRYDREKHLLYGHKDWVNDVAWSPCGSFIATASQDTRIGIWDSNGRHLYWLEGHTNPVNCVGWFLYNSESWLVSASDDHMLRIWDIDKRYCRGRLDAHTDMVYALAIGVNNSIQIASGSLDNTIRIWNIEAVTSDGIVNFLGLEELRILEGHTGAVVSLAYSPDSRLLVSKSHDGSVVFWRTDTWESVAKIYESTDLDLFEVPGIAFSPDGSSLVTLGDMERALRIWDLQPNLLLESLANSIDTHYTNAKVLLVGNSAAGKTGLSNRLAQNTYTETDSTVGAWATQWKLPIESDDGIEKEVWLWDFGGQADQRLIHQLYMDQTQVAALIFDPQKPELLEGLRTWDRDLTRAATGDFQKLLVAGRIDAGGLRSVSRCQVEEFVKEQGFAQYIETSAKENIGCDELKAAICDLIDWDGIAKRTTPALFKRLKEEIVALKDEGRVLMRFKELREVLTLRMGGERFSDAELNTVVSLLGGPGVVWELGFGSWVLLSPELINAYAQAVIRTLQQDDRELGCITEEAVLKGELSYPSDLERLPEEEERILLLAMHRLLVENNLCLSEREEGTGTLLVFPSYARRQRPDLIDHPSIMVSYQFEGFLDDIYATLVVRLHRISPFETTEIWNDAADFKTMTGRKLGVKLSRNAAGKGELLVYFDPSLSIDNRMMFSKYVQEHLLRKAKDREQVKRLRHWVCGNCGEPVANRQRAMQRINDNGAAAKIICVECEKYVPLWDEMEAAFADPDILRRVRDLEAEAQRELDNESKERALVGDVISTVSLAGQISRELSVSDHGIDMEIEFKDDAGNATGQRLYLQLKSGDSYLTQRKRDGAEIFRIPNQRHAEYWMNQAYPVMLVVRNAEGEIRWMEIRDHLRQLTNSGTTPVRQITFEGDRFDVMAVRRWRQRLLGSNTL